MTVIEQLAERAAPLLQQRAILRIRRNHGLEHATIHILGRQGCRLSGRSDSDGFVLLGDVPTEQVESAAHEALQRMQAGESGLAVHPNCGTNLVTAALLATSLGFAGFAGRGWRSAWKRFNIVMTVMMLVLLIAPGLGNDLQRHFTTADDMESVQLTGVKRHDWRLPWGGARLVAHRVATRQTP